jgi:hypothetical protein
VRGSGYLYCSDRCVELARRVRMVTTRSEARAEARAGRKCANESCGKPFEAKRSTKLYCSAGCRIAAHRARY